MACYKSASLQSFLLHYTCLEVIKLKNIQWIDKKVEKTPKKITRKTNKQKNTYNSSSFVLTFWACTGSDLKLRWTPGAWTKAEKKTEFNKTEQSFKISLI